MIKQLVICLNYRHFKNKLRSVIVSQNHYLNKIFDVHPLKTGKYPDRWKVEMGLALNKAKPNNPENESELRIISLTPFLSKTMEKIVLDSLLYHVGDKIDWKQYGGVKGSSVNHYLIDLICFILYNKDL